MPNDIPNNYVDLTYGGETIDLPEGSKYNPDGTKSDDKFAPLEGKKSLLHSLSVIHYNSFNKQLSSLDTLYTKEGDYFSGNNAKGYRNPTGSKIVESFNEDYVSHAMQYKWGDFLFLDHYGKVPNNHLITIRRFPQPCGDNLLNNLENPQRDVSRLLTYIDGEDNTFETVFNFSAGFNWKEFQSDVQTKNKSQTGWGGLDFLGFADTSGEFAGDKLKGQKERDFDPYTEHQDNYTWGPIDVIDKIVTRDRGLIFEQPLTIKFRYAVRSYSGINTKVAFLDILGNMLNMFSNKAPFWGGATRFVGGGGYSGPLGDTNALKNGDVDGFLSSFIEDISGKLAAPFEDGILNGLKDIAGNVGAAFGGMALDKMGKPEMYSLHSLLTAQPTGEWHMTVGNPFNPAMMVGNLIVEQGNIGVEGPFTADDVPSFVTLELTMKHAMPRDKYAIQKMFNFGGTRFYGSNTDFESKSYYRNKDLHGKGKGFPPAKVVQDADSTVESTTAVANNTYQSLLAAYKTA